MVTKHADLTRTRAPHQHHRVTYVELFFDLVFVFAITQISHTLLAHFTPLGGVQTAILFLAVWWVWIFTSWVTNWLDPERAPVRVMLFALMIAGLLLSTSIPKAKLSSPWGRRKGSPASRPQSPRRAMSCLRPIPAIRSTPSAS